jgi:methyltransferase (TIGR00027 family)
MHEIQLKFRGCHWLAQHPAAPFPMSPTRGYGVPPAFEASLTAMATALMRAAHARRDPRPLLVDAWGERLVPALALQSFRDGAVARAGAQARATATPDEILDAALTSASGFANVILRSRYTEDAVRDAAKRGIGQYVLVGAGLDSFALRQPASGAELQIFEVDQFQTQAFKRQRLAECAIPVPRTLHFVPADLARDELPALLARAGYRTAVPAFFSWLGVTMFLSRSANLGTLRSIAAAAAPGSELVFTYLDQRIFQSGAAEFLDLQASVRAVGEPLQGGFDPQQLEADLRSVGFELLLDLSDAELLDQLAGGDARRLVPMKYSRIAHARRLGAA